MQKAWEGVCQEANYLKKVWGRNNLNASYLHKQQTLNWTIYCKSQGDKLSINMNNMWWGLDGKNSQKIVT